MKQLITFSAFAFALTVFAACNKGDDNNSGPYASLESVLTTEAVQSSTFTLNATTGGTFTGPTGTRFIFPANAFLTASGVAVTGTINIQVREFLKPSQMLFSRIMPVSNGDPLVTAGEVEILATQNGNKLRMKAGVPYEARVPQFGQPATGMALFLGQTVENPVNQVNWNLFTDSMRAGGKFGGITYNGDTVSIFSDSLGLANADRFIANPNYQNFTVSLTGITIPASTPVVAVALYDDVRAMWPMYAAVTNGSIQEQHVPNVPVHFVVFTVVDGNFYGGITGATPATGSTYTVQLLSDTPAGFKSKVDAL